VGGRAGEQTAIIYDSPVTHGKARISLRETGGAGRPNRRHACVPEREKGDRVYYLHADESRKPWSAMLACARLGAVHCVVFGGFCRPRLAVRIESTPRQT